jgi:hypothetical protein
MHLAAKRSKQVATAQHTFRQRKRQEGCHRLQLWISETASTNLHALCAEFDLSQAQVLELALAQLTGKQNAR